MDRWISIHYVKLLYLFVVTVLPFSYVEEMLCFHILTNIDVLKVVDCRICGDTNSVLRFAFIEFTDEGRLTHDYSFIYSG